MSNNTYPQYPNTPLSVGSSGSNVSLMQTYLNKLAVYYTCLIKLVVDGKYGENTKQTVMEYQAKVHLKADGIIGQQTWNKIVSDYNKYYPNGGDIYPGTILQQGSSGAPVSHMQTALNICSTIYTVINSQATDGKFGSNMTAATKRFQRQFSLSIDGIIGTNTWNKIVAVRNNVVDGTPSHVSTPYPGYVVQSGQTGEQVRIVQPYINTVNAALGKPWDTMTEDSSFGPQTTSCVMSFQAYFGLKVDGKVGQQTWGKMVAEYNNAL